MIKEYEIFGKTFKHNDLIMIFMGIGILTLVIGGRILFEMLTPSVPTSYTWSGLFKFGFIVLSLGLALGFTNGVHPLLLFKSTKNVTIKNKK